MNSSLFWSVVSLTGVPETAARKARQTIAPLGTCVKRRELTAGERLRAADLGEITEMCSKLFRFVPSRSWEHLPQGPPEVDTTAAFGLKERKLRQLWDSRRDVTAGPVVVAERGCRFVMEIIARMCLQVNEVSPLLPAL